MSRGGAHGLPIVEATTPPVLTLTGPVTPGQAAGLGDAVRALLTGAETAVVICDVAGIGPPGLLTVDLLARLQLAARRAGGRIRLRGPGPELRALLDLVGVPVEVEGEVEEGEPALGVEVEVEPGEAAV
ncbi:STAS domain-containing protein [Streptomyces sp. AK04-3B]|uniref:STAS domain-containing protein n=1 Tax=unclassified Streptomyces TaxID=2593676 RepID=UPI0029BF2221|nr:STAS domain-containing protein [Streptomyces sp. AK04-3B]MDX3801002.1 STAS domain-containing protein [Streptomyces sp. AK04-3B]